MKIAARSASQPIRTTSTWVSSSRASARGRHQPAHARRRPGRRAAPETRARLLLLCERTRRRHRSRSAPDVDAEPNPTAAGNFSDWLRDMRKRPGRSRRHGRGLRRLPRLLHVFLLREGARRRNRAALAASARKPRARPARRSGQPGSWVSRPTATAACCLARVLHLHGSAGNLPQLRLPRVRRGRHGRRRGQARDQRARRALAVHVSRSRPRRTSRGDRGRGLPAPASGAISRAAACPHVPAKSPCSP